MEQTLLRRSDPQPAVAIAEESSRAELLDIPKQCEWLGLSSDQPPEPAVPAGQECPVIIFTQRLYPVRLAGQWKELWRSRSPSPQPVYHPRPQTAPAVFI